MMHTDVRAIAVGGERGAKDESAPFSVETSRYYPFSLGCHEWKIAVDMSLGFICCDIVKRQTHVISLSLSLFLSLSLQVQGKR